MPISLRVEQKNELKKLHKQECYRRYTDRIKVILRIDLGLSYEEIACYLPLDDQTIRNYEKRYQSSGGKGLLSDNYIGCASKLTNMQEEQ